VVGSGLGGIRIILPGEHFNDEPLVTEYALAKTGGYPRTTLRRYRTESLEEGLHYWLDRGSYRYTAEGRWMVEEHFAGRPKRKTAVESAIVLRTYPNPNLVRVELDSGEVANCRVRADGGWRPGLSLEPIRRLGPGLWEYIGAPPRCAVA